MQTPESIGQILSAYYGGISIKDIGKEFSIDPTVVYYYLNRYSDGHVERRVRRYNCQDDLFSQKTEAGLYWLGFCAADGHVSGTEVQLQLAKKDRVVLEEFKVALKTDRKIYDYWDRKFPKSSLYIRSKKLASDLLNFGPDVISNCPTHLQHHLIRGIFDGDGTICCKDYDRSGIIQYLRKVSICGLEKVLVALRDAAAQSGTSFGNLAFSGGIWHWAIQGIVNVRLFRNWLYRDATIYLHRKKDGFISLDRPATARPRVIQAEIRF